MKTTKIEIKNLFGITEKSLGGKSVEITGKKGAGKTSIIDAIRYALTNNSERDYIVKQGANEGEIIVETDTGLSICRKKRTEKADYKLIKENGEDVKKPEAFLNEIFTPLQLNPVAFTQMSKQEQNRTILDLIEFDWDLNWIQEQFGEIPKGVNYEQNILQVLNDIQAENGVYFRERQNVNRDIRNKRAFVEDIVKDIPDNYDAQKWEEYSLAYKYKELETARSYNSAIERAKAFKSTYDNKKRGLEAERDILINSEKEAISSEREGLLKSIERMKAEIKAAEDKICSLDDKLKDKIEIANSKYEEGLAKLNTDIGIANEYTEKQLKETSQLQEEIALAEEMKKHLNEYKRMTELQAQISNLENLEQEYTRKIELARMLPATILQSATIPVEGLSVKDGIPLINGLPISNLSDGEKLDLCVDITISNPKTLQIILIDGAERLDDENRQKLYAKCKEKGLQFIATRTTNDNELEITEL